MLVVVLAFAASLNAVAETPSTADKARTLCAGCHGPAGVSVNPLWPNLAGQQAGYLAKSMRDFKSGARTEPTMAAIASTVGDAEIDALAAYYASLVPQPVAVR
jgi:cytochrome c553